METPTMTAETTGLDLLAAAEAATGLSKDSREFAERLDELDPLASLREQFDVPHGIYFGAHALGACPRAVGPRLLQEVDVWKNVGTKGHVEHSSNRPWVDTDKRHIEVLADIVGALPVEVVHASGLTNNLHVLLQSFYKPTAARPKIIYEVDAFNSDRFALASQVKLAGLDPSEALIGVHARQGETCLRTCDILATIDEHGDSACLVMFGAVNWGTGQVLDIPRITERAHAKGCIVGWDLAHGVGAVPFHLHDWEVDFAVWCSYKYLCSGPGATGGMFVHEKNFDRTRCSGWWGNNITTRFLTVPDFVPREGAAGFVMSNPSVFGTIPLHCSLEIFAQVPKLCAASQTNGHVNGHANGTSVTHDIMPHLARKGRLLTAYLEYLLESLSAKASSQEGSGKVKNSFKLRCISPKTVVERGSTLAVVFEAADAQTDAAMDTSRYSDILTTVIQRLKERDIPVDSRAPNLIRFSPAPLYNTFTEAFTLATGVVKSLV